MSSRTLVVPDVSNLTSLADAQLLGLQSDIAASRRQVDAASAMVAAEIASRSHRDLGYSGLAQASGLRTPERLVASVTGLSVPESRAMIAAGETLTAADEWMTPVATALRSGDVSVTAAAAIRAGLGDPTEAVGADELAAAAQQLVDEAATMRPEQVAQRARELRDELDADGVADREAALRDKRFLKLTPQADGMTRIFGMLDPESAALVTDAIDLDALVEMVRIAGDADSGRVFGVHKPTVRVHVSLSDLERRRGVASIEGQTAAVSVATAERHVCTDGYLPIVLEGMQSLDLGRTQRRFSAAQRAVLAAIWGGCPVGGCDRPPSWTEAHHIDQWDRDRGKTDVRDGILLCRHHHMWLHDRGGRIVRSDNEYELCMPGMAPLRLRSKNPVRRAAIATQSRVA